MKKLIKKLLREGLEEARSIEGNISKDENIGELLTHIYTNYGFENTYVSFRDSEHVGKINPNNKYNTPTGLYTYRLSNYLNKPTYDISKFRSAFPFASDKSHIQFLILKDSINIIDSDYPKSKLDGFVKIIQNKYGKIDPVNGLCERWFNEEYQSYYSESKHSAHKFWLFIYDVIPYVYPNGKRVNSFAILCRELGIDGFSDDKCEGWIHPNEKCQTVFFKSNIFKNQFMLEPKNNDILASKGGYTDNQIIKMLSQHRLDPIKDIDKIIPHLSNEKIKNYIIKSISDIDSNGIESLLRNSKEREKVINILLSNKELISKLNSDGIYYLLKYSSEPEKVMNILGDKGREAISKLDSNGISVLLRYSKEPEKVMNVLGDKGREVISNLNSYDIPILLKYSSEPEKVINILLSNKELISNLNSNGIYYLLKYSSEPEKVMNILLSNEQFISNLDSDGIYSLLGYSPEREKVMNILLSNEQFISNLDSDGIEHLLDYSEESDKVKDLLRKYGHDV